MRQQSSAWGTALLAVLLIAFLIGLGTANARFTQTALDANTFLPRWEAARTWRVDRVSPYDLRVALSAQTRLYGRAALPEQGEDPCLFSDPLPALLLYLPWGFLDYPAARAGWMTLLEVLLVLAAALSLRLANWRPPPMLFALLVAFGVIWPPGIRSIVDGHAAILSMAACLGAVWCIMRRWDVAAGLLLAVTLVDPVAGSLVLVAGMAWAASSQRWSVLVATMLTGGILVGLSLALMPGWPLDWLRQVARLVEWGRQSGLESGFLLQGLRSAPGLLAGGLLLAAAFSLWTCLGHGPRWLLWTMASLLVLGSWLTRVAVGFSSSITLLPAVILVLGSIAQRLPRSGHWIVAAVVLLTGGVSWGWSLSATTGADGGLLGASAAPALACVGLLWVRWWVTRGMQIRELTPESGQA